METCLSIAKSGDRQSIPIVGGRFVVVVGLLSLLACVDVGLLDSIEMLKSKKKRTKSFLYSTY